MIKRSRFFTWYRVLPLAIVLVFGVISYAYSFAPSLIFKSLYPLSYEDEITSSAAAHGVDPYLVAAIIRSESSWDAEAQSHRGAMGLMQLMPETASDMVSKGLVDGSQFSADDLLDPQTNIEFGCAYLSYLLSYFNGATDKAIAAYNAGMGMSIFGHRKTICCETRSRSPKLRHISSALRWHKLVTGNCIPRLFASRPWFCHALALS